MDISIKVYLLTANTVLVEKNLDVRATPTPLHPQMQQASDSSIRTAKRPRKNKTPSILDVTHPAPSSVLFFLRLCAIALSGTGNLGTARLRTSHLGCLKVQARR